MSTIIVDTLKPPAVEHAPAPTSISKIKRNRLALAIAARSTVLNPAVRAETLWKKATIGRCQIGMFLRTPSHSRIESSRVPPKTSAAVPISISFVCSSQRYQLCRQVPCQFLLMSRTTGNPSPPKMISPVIVRLTSGSPWYRVRLSS